MVRVLERVGSFSIFERLLSHLSFPQSHHQRVCNELEVFQFFRGSFTHAIRFYKIMSNFVWYHEEFMENDVPKVPNLYTKSPNHKFFLKPYKNQQQKVRVPKDAMIYIFDSLSVKFCLISWRIYGMRRSRLPNPWKKLREIPTINPLWNLTKINSKKSGSLKMYQLC